ncbi:hypothetical protein KKG05_08650 [bacterium]|nr:hypothetical protein [bacterium]
MTKKFITLAVILLAVAIVAQGQLPSDQQVKDPDPPISGWSAECETYWDAEHGHWIDGHASVLANTSGSATLCVSSPGCTHPPAARFSTVRTGHIIAEAICPPSCQYDCCQTVLWDAQAGTIYGLTASNETTSQACGPTKGKITNGIYNCNQL